jgi:hypothetical protein
MADDFENAIGYKKPPKASQFQKGRSGNPSGRPRKNPSIADVFRRVSRQTVRTNGPKGQQRMTKLEASITQVMNKAASGDLRATKAFMEWVSQFPEMVSEPKGVILEIVGVDRYALPR